MQRSHSPILPLIFLTTLLLLFGARAKADTLHLHEGDIISGKIITFAKGICVFGTKYGPTVTIPIQDITSLSTDGPYEAVFTSGEKAKGRFVIANGNATQIRSETFGDISITPLEIASLTRVFPPKKQDGTSTKQKDESYGEERDETPPLDFLTGSTVLLAPGVWEVEMGMMYKQVRQAYSLMDVGYFQRSAYTSRQLQLSLTGRAGLYDRLEGWLTIPGTYTYIQDVSTNEYVRDTDGWNLGDISFGLQYLLLKESADHPAISASLGVSAPTGNKRYHDVVNTWLDALNNGAGHWSVSPGLTFVRTLDPAILFGGIAYQQAFERTIDGYRVDPGWGLSSYLGIGFALNDKLSLGSRLGWGYMSRMTVDGEVIQGSDNEPIDLSFSASYRFLEDWVATPQVTFGLNDDAGAPALSLRLTRRI